MTLSLAWAAIPFILPSRAMGSRAFSISAAPSAYRICSIPR